MAGGGDLKRKSEQGFPVSPPPLKRKFQSTTTQNAVSSFFTPTSQKPPEKTLWSERGPGGGSLKTLLVGRYEVKDISGLKTSDSKLIPRCKIAAFDFDSTLIQTSSGKTHSSDAQDWKWWHTSVPGTLRKLYMEDGYRVILLSNQAGLILSTDSKTPKSNQTRVTAFKVKVASVFNQLDIPISLYAATEKDIYRKPRPGMWKEMKDDYDLDDTEGVDFQHSFFVGDAGGRLAGGGKGKDFSCSDRDFADNVGISFYTPEEYFLKETPKQFVRSFNPKTFATHAGISIPQDAPFFKRNDVDLVIFCGSPGSGKSTYFSKSLEPLGYVSVSQDVLKTRERCVKAADDYLSQGKSVVVDNTNADADVRKIWVDVAAKHKVNIRCVLFLAEPHVCEHNDAVRAFNPEMNPANRTILPKVAFTSFWSRYKRPAISEGFQDVTEVHFKFRGTEAEREIWSRYWT